MKKIMSISSVFVLSLFLSTSPAWLPFQRPNTRAISCMSDEELGNKIERLMRACVFDRALNYELVLRERHGLAPNSGDWCKFGNFPERELKLLRKHVVGVPLSGRIPEIVYIGQCSVNRNDFFKKIRCFNLKKVASKQRLSKRTTSSKNKHLLFFGDKTMQRKKRRRSNGLVGKHGAVCEITDRRKNQRLLSPIKRHVKKQTKQKPFYNEEEKKEAVTKKCLPPIVGRVKRFVPQSNRGHNEMDWEFLMPEARYARAERLNLERRFSSMDWARKNPWSYKR